MLFYEWNIMKYSSWIVLDYNSPKLFTKHILYSDSWRNQVRWSQIHPQGNMFSSKLQPYAELEFALKQTNQKLTALFSTRIILLVISNPSFGMCSKDLDLQPTGSNVQKSELIWAIRYIFDTRFEWILGKTNGGFCQKRKS